MNNVQKMAQNAAFFMMQSIEWFCPYTVPASRFSSDDCRQKRTGFSGRNSTIVPDCKNDTFPEYLPVHH